MARSLPPLLIFLLLAASSSAYAEDPQSLKELLKDDQLIGDWVYDDVEAGYREAQKTGKPLLVCFSCVP